MLVGYNSDEDTEFGGSRSSLSPPLQALLQFQSFDGDAHSAVASSARRRVDRKLRKPVATLSSKTRSSADAGQPINIRVTLNLDFDTSTKTVCRPIALAGFQTDEVLSTETFLTPLPLSNNTSSSSLSLFNSTLRFWSPARVQTTTTFTVFVDATPKSIHSETTYMHPMPTPTGRTGWFYTVTLCPSFWKVLSNDPSTRSSP